MAAEDVNTLLSDLAKQIDNEDRNCDTVLDLAERVLAAGASAEHQQASSRLTPSPPRLTLSRPGGATAGTALGAHLASHRVLALETD